MVLYRVSVQFCDLNICVNFLRLFLFLSLLHLWFPPVDFVPLLKKQVMLAFIVWKLFLPAYTALLILRFDNKFFVVTPNDKN